MRRSAGISRSTENTRSRVRSHSQIRSTAPRLDGTLPAKTGRLVVAEWPVEPRFHSIPPANQASVSAKLANCRRRLVNTRSRSATRSRSDQSRPPKARKHQRLQPTIRQPKRRDVPWPQVA